MIFNLLDKFRLFFITDNNILYKINLMPFVKNGNFVNEFHKEKKQKEKIFK